jgi:hypothetical protein
VLPRINPILPLGGVFIGGVTRPFRSGGLRLDAIPCLSGIYREKRHTGLKKARFLVEIIAENQCFAKQIPYAAEQRN